MMKVIVVFAAVGSSLFLTPFCFARVHSTQSFARYICLWNLDIWVSFFRFVCLLSGKISGGSWMFLKWGVSSTIYVTRCFDCKGQPKDFPKFSYYKFTIFFLFIFKNYIKTWSSPVFIYFWCCWTPPWTITICKHV
jgi:hypothetical protein